MLATVINYPDSFIIPITALPYVIPLTPYSVYTTLHLVELRLKHRVLIWHSYRGYSSLGILNKVKKIRSLHL